MVSWAMMLAVLAAGGDDRRCTVERELWAETQPPAPCDVKDFEQEWGLDATQAACARNAGRLLPLDRTEKPALHAAWRTCVKQWPGQRLFWRAFLMTWQNTDESMAVLGQLPAAPADGGVALATELLIVPEAPVGAIAAVIAERDPSRLAELLADPRLDQQQRFILAVSALERREPQGREWEALAPPLLAWSLQRGHPMFAAELWLRLPEALRREYVKSPPSWSINWQGANTLPTLALGLISTGNTDEARRISFPPPATQERTELLMREVVAWHLTGKRTGDAWDAAIDCRESDITAWELWAGLLPYVAPHEGLFAERFGQVEAWQRRDRERRGSDLPPFVTRRLAVTEARALARVKQLVPFGPSALDDEQVPAPLPPLMSPFVERETKAKCAKCSALDVSVKAFRTVRAQRVGTKRVVLALSQRLDPVGEVSHGGYWLLVSEREGPWQQHYLGLGDHRPFHALEKSDVPLLDDLGVVRLTMEDAPIEEESISFPPLRTQAPAKRARVVLEAPLARITADSDGDGLSDLVEQRLLLDPAKADTDGDGVKDGDDATPRLDDRLPMTTKAELLNAFFEHFRGGSRAIVVPPRKGREALRAADLDDVRFLEGTPEELAGIRTLGRVITVSPAELAAARQRFGAFYPMAVRLFLNGKDHAFVEWNERWRGGTYRIDRRRDGTLELTRLSWWIT